MNWFRNTTKKSREADCFSAFTLQSKKEIDLGVGTTLPSHQVQSSEPTGTTSRANRVCTGRANILQRTCEDLAAGVRTFCSGRCKTSSLPLPCLLLREIVHRTADTHTPQLGRLRIAQMLQIALGGMIFQAGSRYELTDGGEAVLHRAA